MRPVVRVARRRVPVGDAPGQLVHDIMLQFLRILLGNDDHCRPDILGVGLIHHQRIHRRVNDTVDHDLDIKEQSAASIYHQINQQIQLSHAEAIVFLRKIHAEDIDSSAASAALK